VTTSCAGRLRWGTIAAPSLQLENRVELLANRAYWAELHESRLHFDCDPLYVGN